MTSANKPLVWLQGEVKTPPFSATARVEPGVLLRRLQRGERLGMPHSRPMPAVGTRCHELRIVDAGRTWRIMYRTDADAVFQKTTQQTPPRVIVERRRRLRHYDDAANAED